MQFNNVGLVGGLATPACSLGALPCWGARVFPSLLGRCYVMECNVGLGEIESECAAPCWLGLCCVAMQTGSVSL
jgi:hypothetical protein